MGGPINKEQNGYESIGCYTYCVTLSYDFDIEFSRSIFEIDLSQEWEGRSTRNKMDMNR